MDDEMQWVEGELLALEALRQDGDWVFPRPPASFERPTAPEGKRPIESQVQASRSTEKGEASTPPTMLFVD